MTEHKTTTGGYSAIPRKRRGHRRATSGSEFQGQEPHLVGIEKKDEGRATRSEQDRRDQWLKEQRPPHHYLK